MKRVAIDRDKCCGNLECVLIAPTVFAYDEDGLAVAKIDRVSGDELQSALEAVEACPVQAISLQD